MRNLLALFLLIASPAWAVDLCSVSSIGAQSANGTTNSTVTPALPASYVPGDLLLLHWHSWQGGAISSSDPSGYTLIASSFSQHEIWGKIAGPSESAPSITAGSDGVAGSTAQITAIHNPSGFKISSILGDSNTGFSAGESGLAYKFLTVTQGGGCAFQFATSDLFTGLPSALAVQSGYVAAGFAAGIAGGGAPALGGQMYNGDATTPDLANNTNLFTGNTEAFSDLQISLTLLSGDNTPTTPSFTDKTGQAINTLITSSSVVLAGFDNYTKLVVGAGSDSGCAFSLNGAAYSSATQYPLVGDTLAAEVTSGGAATTKNCVATLGDGTTVSDTFSVSTNASDTTAPTCSVAPTAGSTSAFGTTVTATCSDETDATVTHIIGVVADGASAPTGAQLDACSGGGIIASSCASGSQTNGVSKSLTTPSVLSAATAYDVYMTQKDTSNNYKTPVKVDVTTTNSDQNVPLLLVDHFSGTDGTLLTAPHVPNVIAAGTAYTALGTSSTFLSGNKAVVPVTTIAQIDVGTARHVSDIQWTAAANQIILLGIRTLDSTNYVACFFDEAADLVKLNTIVSGVQTVLGSAAVPFVAGNTYRLTANATPGDVLGCAVDGVEKVTVATSAFNTSTFVSIGNLGSGQATFDDWYVHLAYDALNSSGFVPDDPNGILQGLQIGNGSAFYVKPGSDPTTICSIYSFYSGGSLYCVPQSGTTTINMELLNTTSNTLSTIPLTIINPGGGAVAPVLNAIPDETVTINIDPGPRDLTAFLTAGQPAPTWSLTAGYDTATGQLCPGRILSVSGNVSGICTVPGTYAVTAKALNASGNATRSFNEVVQADTTPDPFSFTDIFNVGVGTSQVTNPCVTISGANYTMTTTISAGTWTKNGGAPSGAGGTAVNGDVICLQGTASGSTGTAVNAVFCAGGVCDTWTIITNPDVDPTPISFTPHSNVLPSSTVTSNCQDIAGISAGSTVSILLSSGKWTKNCSAAQPTYTTASAGTATLGDSIGLQHTASASHSSPTVQTLTYGNRTATFVSVTDSGTAPTCSAIDPVSGNVGNVFLMDLNNHSTGVLQFTASPLPGGITASGGILSGIFNAITSPTLTTNVIGSNNYGSCTTSIAFTVQNLQAHCDDIPLQTKHINDAVNIDLNLWCTNAISYTATPLPAGLTFISPKIVGTVTTVGPVTTTIQAANTANTFSGTLSWNILTPEGTDQTIGSTPGDTNGATGDKGHTVPSEKH